SHDPGVRGFSSAGGAPCELGYGCYLGHGGGESRIAATSVDGPAAPAEVRLVSAGPNPFRGRTAFELSLPEEREVRVTVYDVRGRRVRRLQSGPLPAGRHVIDWDGTSADRGRVADGVYFMRLLAGDEVRTAKVVLARTR
ncbi:MAG TPA: FlgD immunoglobulin-like domain containing protein, partial [bacterium]|nr:FlgD immunoglobulin-like domain containing protein [bacterium]